MFKLLKNMRRKEKLMALLCLVFVVVQVYFDLRLPDFMTELTTLIKTSGTTSDIVNVGLKMLGCTTASAVLAIACGFLAAKTASGFSFAVRDKLFRHVMDIGSEEMQDFSIPSLITRTTNDITQIQMIVAMGLQMLIKAPHYGSLGSYKNSRQELGAFRCNCRIRCGAVCYGPAHHEFLHSALPPRPENDR